MKHGSLFSGIGGFDLAAEWMGWQNIFHCECNEFGQKILKHYWPNAISYGDITTTDFNVHRGQIDILTGGFPCQKYSIAGARIGEEPLKEEFVRVIREVQAPWLLIENVYNFISEQFAEEHNSLCQQLENMGYQCQTFDIDAASCGIPTVERHIWIVATSDGFRQKRGQQEKIQNKPLLQGKFQGSNKREGNRWQLPSSRVCELGKGFPFELDAIAVSKWHGESVQAIGNAIVPQVAYEIFKAIEMIEYPLLNGVD